jgi:hypothetical protein
VTVLARMVTAVRAEASERLWQQLTDHIDSQSPLRGQHWSRAPPTLT